MLPKRFQQLEFDTTVFFNASNNPNKIQGDVKETKTSKETPQLKRSVLFSALLIAFPVCAIIGVVLLIYFYAIYNPDNLDNRLSNMQISQEKLNMRPSLEISGYFFIALAILFGFALPFIG
jgi:ATP-dependent Zn protease